MYTIEDLKQGKCAILNDGTVDELNKILSLIEWPFRVYGSERYYWIDFTGANCGQSIPNVPIQSVKDFIKQLDMKIEDRSDRTEPLYKVGDIVTIKDKYDYNFSKHDYPFSFTEYMKDHYGGKKCMISRVIYNSNCEDKPTYTEPFEYKLDGLNENSLSWSAAMFKETPSSLFKCNKDKKDEELEESPKEFTFSEEDFTIPTLYKEVELVINKPICKF